MTTEPVEKKTPVYPNTMRYAAEHGEMSQYLESARENASCMKAIEQSIREYYANYQLDPVGSEEVLKRFGRERVQFILALTIQHKQRDGRISPENRKWADIMNMPQDSEMYQDTAQFVVNQVHPGLLDLFTTQTRRIISQQDLSKQKNQERER